MYAFIQSVHFGSGDMKEIFMSNKKRVLSNVFLLNKVDVFV